jgi:hypothetical protein
MVGHGGKRLDFVFPRCSCIFGAHDSPPGLFVASRVTVVTGICRWYGIGFSGLRSPAHLSVSSVTNVS